jgi:hypothetical protein
VIFSGCRVAGAAVAKLAYAVGLKSTGVFPVVGSSPTSRTIFISVHNDSTSSFAPLTLFLDSLRLWIIAVHSFTMNNEEFCHG